MIRLDIDFYIRVVSPSGSWNLFGKGPNDAAQYRRRVDLVNHQRAHFGLFGLYETIASYNEIWFHMSRNSKSECIVVGSRILYLRKKNGLECKFWFCIAQNLRFDIINKGLVKLCDITILCNNMY